MISAGETKPVGHGHGAPQPPQAHPAAPKEAEGEEQEVVASEGEGEGAEGSEAGAKKPKEKYKPEVEFTKVTEEGHYPYAEIHIKTKEELERGRFAGRVKVQKPELAKVDQCTWEGGPRITDLVINAIQVKFINAAEAVGGKDSFVLVDPDIFDDESNPQYLGPTDPARNLFSDFRVQPPAGISAEAYNTQRRWTDFQATLNVFTMELYMQQMAIASQLPESMQDLMGPQRLMYRLICSGEPNKDGTLPLFVGDGNAYVDNTAKGDLTEVGSKPIHFPPGFPLTDVNIVRVIFGGQIPLSDYYIQRQKTPQGEVRKIHYKGDETGLDRALGNIRATGYFDPNKSWFDTDQEDAIEEGFDSAFDAPINWGEVNFQTWLVVIGGIVTLVGLYWIQRRSTRTMIDFQKKEAVENRRFMRAMQEGKEAKTPYLTQAPDEVANWRTKFATNPESLKWVPVGSRVIHKVEQMVIILSAGRNANALASGRKGTGKSFVSQTALSYYIARGYRDGGDYHRLRMPTELRNAEIRYFDTDRSFKSTARADYITVASQNLNRLFDEIAWINEAIYEAGKAAAKAAQKPGATPESVARVAAETVAEFVYEKYSRSDWFDETTARKRAITEAGRRARINASAKAIHDYNYQAQQAIEDAVKQCIDQTLENGSELSPKEVAARATEAAMTKAQELEVKPSVKLVAEEAGSGWVFAMLDELQVLFEKGSEKGASLKLQEVLKRLSQSRFIRAIGTTDQISSMQAIDEAATDRWTEVHFEEPTAEEAARDYIETREFNSQQPAFEGRTYADEAAQIAAALTDADKTKSHPRKGMKLLERTAARLRAEGCPISQQIEAADVIQQVRLEVADAMKASVDAAVESVDSRAESQDLERKLNDATDRALKHRLTNYDPPSESKAEGRVVALDGSRASAPMTPQQETSARLREIVMEGWLREPMVRASFEATSLTDLKQGYVDEVLGRLQEQRRLGGLELKPEFVAELQAKRGRNGGGNGKGGTGGAQGPTSPESGGGAGQAGGAPADDPSRAGPGTAAERVALTESEIVQGKSRGRNLITEAIKGPASVGTHAGVFGAVEVFAHPKINWLSQRVKNSMIHTYLGGTIALDINAAPALALLYYPFFWGSVMTSVALDATGIKGFEGPSKDSPHGSPANLFGSVVGSFAGAATAAKGYATMIRNPIVQAFQNRGMLQAASSRLGGAEAVNELAQQTLRPVGWAMRQVKLGAVLDKGAALQASLRQGVAAGVQIAKQVPGQIVQGVRAVGSAIAQRRAAVAGGTAGSIGIGVMAKTAVEFLGAKVAIAGGGAAASGAAVVAAQAVLIAGTGVATYAATRYVDEKVGYTNLLSNVTWRATDAALGVFTGDWDRVKGSTERHESIAERNARNAKEKPKTPKAPEPKLPATKDDRPLVASRSNAIDMINKAIHHERTGEFFTPDPDIPQLF